MRNQWEKLSPKTKRILIIGGVALGAVLLIGVFSDDTSDKPRVAKRDDAIRQVLTDRDTRTVGLDSLSAKIKHLERKNRDLERQMEVFTLDKTTNGDSDESVRALSSKLEAVELELQKLQSAEVNKVFEPAEGEKSATGNETTSAEASERRTSEMTMPHRIVKTVDDVFAPRRYTPPAGGKEDQYQTEELEGANTQPKKTLTIHSHVAAVEEAAEESAEEDSEMYLPVGSILTGVFINGLDAPTGNAARRDPFPATLRIQKEAILPNRFRADVRECFMMVSGYGDLSSERAYLRGEAISCVREDGGVIEATLDSYAVGEDGKAGVRGRLVSKEGQLIARSLMAGFLEGAAGAFNVQQAPSIRIQRESDSDSDTAPVYKQAFDADTMQGAVASGAGSALSRIADYYIKMAESIFPVIEVDAGRQIDVFITRGTALKIRSKGTK